MIRVKFTVNREGAGNGKVWWAAYPQSAVQITGEGSGRRVGIDKYAIPHWLPKPAGREKYMSRAKGTLVDGEAWVDLPAGTILRAYAEMAGGLRHASVLSPVLIVEDGARWEGYNADGTREVEIVIENARPLRLEEAESMVKGVNNDDAHEAAAH